MALPVAPPPKPNDTGVLGWAGLTVRVAWTLLAVGVKVRPDVLRDARMHVLYQLDPAVPLPQAEDFATRWVEAYVARARGQAPVDPWPVDWEMPLSPRWPEALARSGDATTEAVFRKHYGDARGLARLEALLGVERAALESAQAGLREAIRRIGVADGLPLDGWDADRLDRLLRRIAGYAPGPCPPPLDVAEGCHREHVVGCPRCDRTLRLLRVNVVTVDDLYPPTVGARPSGRARVLALQVHPDARRARRGLTEELPVPAFPIGDDIVLLDGAAIDGIANVLKTAAEVGMPARHHLRAALLDGPGTWTGHGLVGPLPERAFRVVQERSWGLADGVGQLPDVLPEPPSARRWWLAAGVAVAVAAVMVALASVPPPSPGGPTLDVTFAPGRGGTWVAFDVPETSTVALVAEHDGALVPILASTTPADKGQYATGDGSYRVHVAADAVVIAAADGPIRGLADAIRAADGASDPAEALAAALATRLHDPDRVRWFRR